MDIPDWPGDGVKMRGNIHQKYLWKFHQDLTSGTMSRLHLPSKSLPGVLEDMDIPDEAGDGFRSGEHPSKVSVKVSSRSDIRNHVKTPPVLQVFSWSLGGHWYSWWTWIWCQMGANIHQKLLWKFHQDPTCFGWFRDDLELWVVGWWWGGGGLSKNLVKP